MIELAQSAERPMFLAFSRSAAREIKSRCKFDSSTIHSYVFAECGMTRQQVVDYAKLREFGVLIGYEFTDPNAEEMPTVGDVLLQMHQYRVATEKTLEDVYTAFHPDEASFDMFVHFQRSYDRWKGSFGVADFNDMLLRFLRLPEIAFGYKELFVDEAQDLSPLQWRVIERLAGRCDKVYIAGDDDQAVHAWAGADPAGMARFAEQWDADSRVLSQSHRVPRAVHTLAQRVIGQVTQRVPKTYLPRPEDGFVSHYGRLDIAIEESGLGSMVLCRDKSVRTEVERWFIEHAVPYTGGLFESRYATAIRELRKLQKGRPNRFNEKTLRKNVALEDAVCMDAIDAVSIPPYWYEYFRDVDLDCENPYILSTIHASKGQEASRVVLVNGMSNRVYSNLDDSEYRVWYVGVTRAKQQLRVVHLDNPLPVLL